MRRIFLRYRDKLPREIRTGKSSIKKQPNCHVLFNLLDITLGWIDTSLFINTVFMVWEAFSCWQMSLCRWRRLHGAPLGPFNFTYSRYEICQFLSKSLTWNQIKDMQLRCKNLRLLPCLDYGPRSLGLAGIIGLLSGPRCRLQLLGSDYLPK